MKRFTAVAVGLLVLAACQDSTMPGTDGQGLEQPNISITSPDMSYGFVDGFFSFMKPLVDNPTILGTRLNTNLMPKIELWQWDQLFIEPSGTDHACVAKSGGTGPMATFTPNPNSDSTYYEYGWKTSDQNLTTGTVYRLCVKVQLADGPQVVGWRDIRPDKTNDPNNPAGTPYLFQNGSNIPIKFWISGKSLCYDASGNVIDCTIATFDANGGTAYCDDSQCGIYVPAGVIPSGGELATFVVKYVACPDSSTQTGTVNYLPDLDIPQFPGCLEVTTYASYDFSGGFGAGDFEGITTAACRDVSLLGPQDERLLLHLESPDNPNTIYALPTRPFDLNCDPTNLVQAPGADGSIGDWARYYAARGAHAFKRALPFVGTPELNAAHAGFGGGTSLTCGDAAVAGADGISQVTRCSSPNLVADGGLSAAPAIEPGTPVTFKMVWALPSKIVARYRVTSLGPPLTTTNWIDPVSVASGGKLYPAVKVTDECKPDADPYELPDGSVHYETCGDPGDAPKPVEGARVWFDVGGGSPVYGYTNADGIAYPSAGWTVPTASGLYTATASGLGIGVDPTLASVTLSPPPAVGTYQDHVGNTAVLLQAPKVKFEASVCSDYRSVLTTPEVDPVYTTKGSKQPIPINISGAGSTAYLYTLTDCYNTYFALEVPATQDLQNSLRIVFVDEQTYGGPLPTGQFSAVPVAGTLPARSDDMWMIRRATKKDTKPVGTWLLEDWHVSNDCTGSSKQSECGAYDVPINGEPGQNLIPGSDGLAVHEVGGATVFEFARRFVAPVDPQDFPVPAVGQSVKVGFYLVLQMGSGAQGNTEWPGFRLFQPFTITRK
jgi:hypothetical protein